MKADSVLVTFLKNVSMPDKGAFYFDVATMDVEPNRCWWKRWRNAAKNGMQICSDAHGVSNDELEHVRA